MCINSTAKKHLVLLFSCLMFFEICFAESQPPFQGELNSDNINIRSDSNVNSEIICRINKGDRIEVIQELYDWYKIKLPKNAPAFIKKNLVIPIDAKTAKVARDRVNIRLKANESSPIIGRINQGELIIILKDEQQWYQIEPVNSTFGWINKRFVNKVIPEENKLVSQATTLDENNVILEGILKPKIMKRIATHKLITQDKRVFLLKGNQEILDALNYHKVRVIGKLINLSEGNYSLIKIEKIEQIN